MADVMEERIRSVQRTAGWAFTLGSILLGISILTHPTFPQVNQTNLVLQEITRAHGGSWMLFHALMILGFFLVTVGFSALAFLLHLKGSSGSASIVATSALIGGALWIAFLSAELYAYHFFANLYSIDPGGATMLFSTVWFWKLGALVVAGILQFLAVFFAGMAATKREVAPAWLGLVGALFAMIGTLYYAVDFWTSTTTGAAIQPMQSPAARYGIGLPLQIWVLVMGITLLREYFATAPVPRVTQARAGAPGTSRTPGGASEPPKAPPPPQIYPG